MLPTKGGNQTATSAQGSRNQMCYNKVSDRGFEMALTVFTASVADRSLRIVPEHEETH